MVKRALITGITGQDGSYLAELLLEKGYEVHGIKRRSSSFNTARIDHLFQERYDHNKRFILHYGDLSDATNLIRIIQEVQPTELYNLAAQSHVAVSFETPEYTAQTDALGTLRILEAIRILKLTDKVKFYQASTSELYGNTTEIPQSETTPFAPRSPYAAAKLYAYWITKNYRDAYNMFTCNGILFNHESPRRGETFVTRKISRAVSRIAHGIQDCLYLGNIDAKRDWGYAKDYVQAMWKMMQLDTPEDMVIATGESHSVKDFVNHAFSCIGKTLTWQGANINEIAIDQEGITRVRIDPFYYRPTDVNYLCGNSEKARKLLSFKPSISFKQLVALMVEHDMKKITQEETTHEKNTLFAHNRSNSGNHGKKCKNLCSRP